MFKMFGKLRNIIIAAAVSSVVLLTVCPSRADVTGRPHDLSLDNPRGHCINCHDLHQTGLGEGFAHNLKRANEVAVCYQCHAGALNDYSSIDPSYPNPSELESNYDIRSEFNQTHIHFERYGMDGENNHCSDCHNPHGVFNASSTTRLPKLLSAGPDKVTDTDEFCFVCHNSDQNPPHSPFPNISVGSQYRFSRTTYKQMTHSTFARATTLTEPVPDTARTYDDNPYGKGKDISCLTCHRPHGSPNDHMLRSPDDETFCLTCHDGTKAADLSEFDVTGHGKAGADRICQDCHFPHGTGQENAIKTGITDPHTGTEKPADVNGSGMNAACMACHSEAQTGVYSNAFPSNVSGWSYHDMGRHERAQRTRLAQAGNDRRYRPVLLHHLLHSEAEHAVRDVWLPVPPAGPVRHGCKASGDRVQLVKRRDGRQELHQLDHDRRHVDVQVLHPHYRGHDRKGNTEAQPQQCRHGILG